MRYFGWEKAKRNKSGPGNVLAGPLFEVPWLRPAEGPSKYL